MPSVSESYFNNRVRADKEAFQAVREALEIAPVVWDQIEEALGDISGRDTQHVLENARLVTRKLSDDVHAISDDSPESVGKAISDSAHIFLKVRGSCPDLCDNQGSMILFLGFCPIVKHVKVKLRLWFYIDCPTIKYGKTYQLD
jgi:hypothetical protein